MTIHKCTIATSQQRKGGRADVHGTNHHFEPLTCACHDPACCPNKKHIETHMCHSPALISSILIHSAVHACVWLGMRVYLCEYTYQRVRMIVHSCTSRTYRGGEGSALLLLLLRGGQVMDADKHACAISCMRREKCLPIVNMPQ